MRNEKSTKASQAHQLKDYPAFQWAHERAKEKIINRMESHTFDGTEMNERKAKNFVLELQALNRVHAELKDAIDAHEAELDRKTRKPRIV